MFTLFDINDLLLLIAVFIVLGIGIFIKVAMKERQVGKLLQLASKRLGGKVIGKGMGHPELRFEQSGTTGTIKFFEDKKRGGEHFTILAFGLPGGAPFSLHLCSKDYSAGMARISRGEEVRLENAMLDQRFSLRTTDKSRAQIMLNEEARGAIAKLLALHPKGYLEVLLHESELVINIPGYLKKPDQVLGLGFMGAKILKRFVAASGWGGLPQVDPRSKRCGVCDEPVTSTAIRCSYCHCAWHEACADPGVCPACGAPVDSGPK